VHNVFDPRQNLLGGAKYLDQQLQSFGNEMAALAAYNAGPNRIRRGSLPPETREYVKKVLAVKNLLGSQ
jgi:soluble lytic murein transglycosylase-like protein